MKMRRCSIIKTEKGRQLPKRHGSIQAGALLGCIDVGEHAEGSGCTMKSLVRCHQSVGAKVFTKKKRDASGRMSSDGFNCRRAVSPEERKKKDSPSC